MQTVSLFTQMQNSNFGMPLTGNKGNRLDFQGYMLQLCHAGD